MPAVLLLEVLGAGKNNEGMRKRQNLGVNSPNAKDVVLNIWIVL